MKIKYLYMDKDGKVSLTRRELDEIMNQCYEDGYNDGKHSTSYITTPYYNYTEITCDGLTADKAYCTTKVNSICSTANDTLNELATYTIEGVNSALEGKVTAKETVIG